MTGARRLAAGGLAMVALAVTSLPAFAANKRPVPTPKPKPAAPAKPGTAFWSTSRPAVHG